MNVEIRDAEAVRAIRPVDAALYLRAMGWNKNSAQADRASTWHKRIDGEEFEVLLPMAVDLRDYALRIGDLLKVLAAVEKRSQRQVYDDLLTITSDVVRIRIADPELSDGTLPIEEHVQLAPQARDLVLAAACAATAHRAVWRKRKPDQAMEHMRRVRIGQSERGSYVVTVINRVPPLLYPQSSPQFQAADPFERKVTQTLAQSLVVLDRAAEEAALTQEMTAFDKAVSQGVNANLCDALVGLWGGDEPQRSLEFAFSWSPARPIKAGAVHRVGFSADRIPVIREAARQMREREPVCDFELRGHVIKLERPDGATHGRVTVSGLAECRPTRIALELPENQYHLAVLAHDRGHILRTLGILVKEGQGFVLKNPSDLEIEPE